MFNALIPQCALALLSLPMAAPYAELPAHTSSPAALIQPQRAQRSVAAYMPADSILFLEAPGLQPFLEAGLEHPLLETLLDSELGTALVDQSQVSLAQKLKFIDAVFGEPVLPALQRASSQGLGLSVSVRSGFPATLFVMRGDDAKGTDRSIKRLFKLLQGKGIDPEPKRHGKADLWTLPDDAVLLKQDALVLFATNLELAEEALELGRSKRADGLLGRPAFERVMGERERPATLRAWVDRVALEQADPKKYAWMEQLQHTAKGQLLLGSGLSTLMSSSALGMDLALQEQGLDVQLWGADIEWLAPLGPEPEDAQFAKPKAFEDLPCLGQAMFYRDLKTFFAERPKLLLPRELPGVSEALTTLSLFFGGMDFGEEVSPDLSPWIHVVSSELDYDAGPTPELKLPGAALIVELRDPEQAGQRWSAAFQSVIGIINIDSAQKSGGRGSMLLGLSLEGDTVISSASYPSPPEGEPVDKRYNLRLSSCVVDGRLVLGTHEDLVRQVIRAIKSEKPSRRRANSAPTETLHLEAQPLASLVRANFDTMVMNKVVDEGVSFEKASEDIEGLALALKLFESLDFEVDYSDPSALQASLRLRLASSGSKAR